MEPYSCCMFTGWPLNSLCPFEPQMAGGHKCLQAQRWLSFDLKTSLSLSDPPPPVFFLFSLTDLAATQIYCMTAGGWWREQSCTYPSLCNVICRTAFARQSTARTEARLTCVRCVRSQGRRRRRKCSGMWWSQNCPWSRIENDTSEWSCGGNNNWTWGLVLDDDLAIYMQKRINKSVSLGLCRPTTRWIGRHSETTKSSVFVWDLQDLPLL